MHVYWRFPHFIIGNNALHIRYSVYKTSHKSEQLNFYLQAIWLFTIHEQVRCVVNKLLAKMPSSRYKDLKL